MRVVCIVHPLYRDELHFERSFTCSLTASTSGLSCLSTVCLAFAYTIWLPLCPKPVCLVCGVCMFERAVSLLFDSIIPVSVGYYFCIITGGGSCIFFFFIMSASMKDALCTELVDRRMRVEGAGHRCWLIILFNELKSEHCVRCTYI